MNYNLKPIIYEVLFLLLGVGTMLSCFTNEESGSEGGRVSTKSGGLYLANPGANRKIDFNRPGNDLCYSTGGNCLPDVVITKPRKPRKNHIFEEVLSGDSARIINVFSEEKDFLLEDMEAGVVNGVINGELTVVGKQLDNMTYFIFYSSNTEEPEAVYPYVDDVK